VAKESWQNCPVGDQEKKTEKGEKKKQAAIWYRSTCRKVHIKTREKGANRSTEFGKTNFRKKSQKSTGGGTTAPTGEE